VIPKYANINFQNTSPVTQFTSKKAQTTCIKDEIKFLYKKKENLNRELYEHHLKAAKEWDRMWYSIQNHIIEKLNQNTEKKIQKSRFENKQINPGSEQKPRHQHLVLS